MTRKKRQTTAVADTTGSTMTETPSQKMSAQAAEPEPTDAQPLERPAYIDGPPVMEDGEVAPDAKNWGDPYKAIITTASFSLGENRRFNQRVFIFKERPSDDVLAALKENGFVYRANDKAWTIPANPDTRRLSDELAREFAGQTLGMSRG